MSDDSMIHKGAVSLVIVIAVSSFSWPLTASANGAVFESTPLLPHGPIAIENDTDFTAANGVTGGSGSSSDPYLIQRWDIDGSSAGLVGILIRNTTAYFIIRNVQIHSARNGLFLERVAHGSMDGVYVLDSTNGIQIISAEDISVHRSRLVSNAGFGIGVWASSGITIVENEIARNLIGIQAGHSSGVVVRQNNIMNNDRQAFDLPWGGNSWYGGYPSGGNYWTDYQGEDHCSGPDQRLCTGPDGIGDTPYELLYNNRDPYPLMALPGSRGDTGPPAVSIISPDNGESLTALTTTVSGTASDSASGVRRVEARVNGGNWDIAKGTSSWSISVKLYLVPTNVIEVRAWDHAGNPSPAASVTVHLDAHVDVTVSTEKRAFAIGEPINITVVLTNVDESSITLNFPSSCKAHFTVGDMSGRILYRPSLVCLGMTTSLTLEAGQSAKFAFAWTQLDASGNRVPVPNEFAIRGVIDSYELVPEGATRVSIGMQPAPTVPIGFAWLFQPVLRQVDPPEGLSVLPRRAP